MAIFWKFSRSQAAFGITFRFTGGYQKQDKIPEEGYCMEGLILDFSIKR
jgi:hypothetical protein